MEYIFYKSSEKDVDQLYVTYPFPIVVLNEVTQATVGKYKWENMTLDD